MARYIDVDEFEKYINREEWKTPDEKWWPERELGMLLDAIPTADVQPVVRGKWFPGRVFPVECSNCGRGSVQPENFCMSCGADMRGENK